MAYLKYYRLENERHAEVVAQNVSFDRAVEMARALFVHFKVKEIPVELLDHRLKKFSRQRAEHSYFMPWTPKQESHIVLHPSMLNPLTVAHEVAHYVHYLAMEKDKANHRRLDAKCGRYTPYVKENWHGPRHKAFTNAGVTFLKEKFPARANTLSGLFEIFDSLMGIGKPTTEKDPYDTMPPRAICPCCKVDLPVRRFGLRVMKRNADGTAAVVRRQSYCRGCR